MSSAASPAPEQGLVIRQVSHKFARTTVVSAASLSVMPGEIHCLLGPSGSGKTTLLRLVAGLERLQQGQIAILGAEVASPQRHIPPERRSVGFVFQDYALFPHLSVRDNVCFGIASRRRAARRERASSLLAHVGMSDFAQAMPHTLSGGQQQRVALARALGRDPAVMLLDEPFSGLDARLRDEVRSTTLAVLKSSQVATLMVTHDPLEAMLVADTISIIHNGRIEQSGTPDQLYAHPVNERVARTLGEANCFQGQVTAGQVSTPFGLIAAPSCRDGERATVILRPESIVIASASSATSVPAVVVSAKRVGESTRIEVELACGQRLISLARSTTEHLAETTVHLSLAETSCQVVGSGL